MQSLTEISKKYNSDKSNQHHNYMDIYSYFFKDLRNKPIDLLEIGIYKGESLRIWREYFKKGMIYGIDIDPDCIFNTDRIKTFYGSSTDEFFINEIIRSLNFDIIIDDGSHKIKDQIRTLELLFTSLKKNGLYIIEDVKCIERFGKYFAYFYPCTIVDQRYISGVDDSVLVIYKKQSYMSNYHFNFSFFKDLIDLNYKLLKTKFKEREIYGD